MVGCSQTPLHPGADSGERNHRGGDGRTQVLKRHGGVRRVRRPYSGGAVAAAQGWGSCALLLRIGFISVLGLGC
ncbi:hypothetical protein V6Z11_A04G139600 [Gossypium hirsutum]